MINFSVKNVIEYPGKKLESFDTFRSLKSNQWSQKVHSNKKKKQEEDVVINIGLMRISDSKLKPKRGKRVALRVSLQMILIMISWKRLLRSGLHIIVIAIVRMEITCWYLTIVLKHQQNIKDINIYF